MGQRALSKKQGGKKNRRRGKREKVVGGMIRHFESLSTKGKHKAKNTGERVESVPKIVKLTRLMKRSITNI